LIKKEDNKVEDFADPNAGLSGNDGDPLKYIVANCVNEKCKQTRDI